MSKLIQTTVIGACLAFPTALLADFQYQETTQITGGSVMGLMKMAGTFSSQARKADQPVTSTVLVKGNRMARIRPDGMEIIDLDRGTITQIDTVKRQYTTMTFDQMRQQVEQAQRDAQAKQASAPARPDSPTQPSNVDMSYDVKVRNTGATRQVSGVDTNEAIMTLSMIARDKTTQQKGALGVTNDMWMAPDIPGYDEVRAFDERMAKKMGTVFKGSSSAPGLSALLAQPGAAKSLESMAAEMQKLKGIPVLQVMRMGSTADGSPLPAASEAPLPKTADPELPSAGDVAQQTATSVLANKVGGLGGAAIGSLGGLGGFGRKKKADPPPPAADAETNSQAQSAAAGVLIESNTTMGGFSSGAIDPARFEIPAGYKEVSANMQDKSH